MKIYRLYWSDNSVLVEIDGTIEEVNELLAKYREENPEEYHVDGFQTFLEERGISTKRIEPDYELFF